MDDSPSQPPTLPQLQQLVDDWIGQWDDGYWAPLSNLARLSEEVGELARVINLLEGDKPAKSDTNPPTDHELEEEFGDLLFVLVTLANSMEIDLASALERALHKYEVRDAERHD